MSGHYGFEMRADYSSTYGNPKKPPTTPKPSTPIAKPIPKKQPAPKGDNSDD